MDCVFEVIVQLLGEFFVGAFFELLSEGIGRFFGWLFGLGGGRSAAGIAENADGSSESPPESESARLAEENLKIGRAVLWQMLGVAIGFLSLLILPSHMIKTTAVRIVNLLITPVAMAAVMVQWGKFLGRRDRRRTPLNHFICAYGFALCYLLVRLIFAK